MKQLGLVTIGQAPRSDLVPEIAPLLKGAELVERGVLDDCTAAEIVQMQRERKGQALATRLRDGSGVVIGEADVVPRLMGKMVELEQEGVDAIALLCTGSFPDVPVKIPLLKAEPLLGQFVKAVGIGPIGVLTPDEAQRPFQQVRWEKLLCEPVKIAVANPYLSGAVDCVGKAAKELSEQGVQMIVLDCLGYSGAMRDKARAEAGLPTALARTVLARAAAEVLGL